VSFHAASLISVRTERPGTNPNLHDLRRRPGLLCPIWANCLRLHEGDEALPTTFGGNRTRISSLLNGEPARSSACSTTELRKTMVVSHRAQAECIIRPMSGQISLRSPFLAAHPSHGLITSNRLPGDVIHPDRASFHSHGNRLLIHLLVAASARHSCTSACRAVWELVVHGLLRMVLAYPASVMTDGACTGQISHHGISQLLRYYVAGVKRSRSGRFSAYSLRARATNSASIEDMHSHTASK
jgi:hypothetical protein